MKQDLSLGELVKNQILLLKQPLGLRKVSETLSGFHSTEHQVPRSYPHAQAPQQRRKNGGREEEGRRKDNLKHLTTIKQMKYEMK
jgi:hypothetical protein